jgi:hypothetical protein
MKSTTKDSAHSGKESLTEMTRHIVRAPVLSEIVKLNRRGRALLRAVIDSENRPCIWVNMGAMKSAEELTEELWRGAAMLYGWPAFAAAAEKTGAVWTKKIAANGTVDPIRMLTDTTLVLEVLNDEKRNLVVVLNEFGQSRFFPQQLPETWELAARCRGFVKYIFLFGSLDVLTPEEHRMLTGTSSDNPALDLIEEEQNAVPPDLSPDRTLN